MNYEVLKEQIAKAGIVGAGGAGFPTQFKLAKGMDYLIINGAECEPLLYTDYQILTHFGKELIDTLHELLEICEIKQGIIGIKKKYNELISTLRDYTQRYPEIHIQAVDNIYPVGDEVTLIYECTGRVIPRGELPVSQKVVEINVETLLNIERCLRNGEPVTHTYMTVGGVVPNPKVVKAPIGIKVRELLKLIGIEDLEDKSILVGGPMMGQFEDLDTLITKTTKGILILPQDHILHKLKGSPDMSAVKRAMSSCSQCRMCTDLCPRNRLGHKVEPHKVMNAIANGLTTHYEGIETALGCCGCNVCSYFACHHELSPSKFMALIKKELLAHGERGIKDLNPIPKKEIGTKVVASRLTSRIGLSQYDQKAQWDEITLIPSRVTISTSQHIGKKAKVLVQAGDQVEVGSLIAQMDEGGISANIHASVTGKVLCVQEDQIIIESLDDKEGR
ncbi:4Fe-4S dicluster domain-containing protein [Zhenhengia yiwuensis]|uniref:4Fe-4S dicluster domain-containing protein n=1 Tax=Zhenhengia yiwuensis TaxID=2763666 RepID=UPI002A7545B5|nr:4Fe-4S dicluster domain-containing protein [Zhenhengia yiwuensis]MDY3366982.1 4Fe-4S dicluster domain-containing protein [Zhenhengia yiwuensis]